jgi:hypothetical protein
LDKALGQLKDKDIEQIIERTIIEGRSIGTLVLGFRELKKKGLLKKWESKVSPEHYLRLITANGDLIAGLLVIKELMPIFLFLWNIYALFITVKDKMHFNDWLNPAIKEGIFKRIKKNKNLRYFNPEYEHLLKLVGLLAYLDIQSSRLRSIFSSSYRPNTSRRFLGDKVEKLDFLPGCFFLLGVEFFLGKRVYSHYWDLVKEKKDRYKMQTAALRKLIRAVLKGIK